MSAEPEPIEILKYPYPYQAAFAVASDIDGGSLLRFRGIHALFCGPGLVKQNSPEWQALGCRTDSIWFDRERGGIPGLGLDFADSFFLVASASTFGLYRHLAEEDRFEEDGQEGENCATWVRRWLREGQIDSFHAFHHYSRKRVEPLLGEFYHWCERENVAKPRVWINHSAAVTPSGLCPDRLQPNRVFRLARLAGRSVVGPLFGRERRPLRYAFVRYQGDTPGSPYYVNDLLSANGLRYVWLNMDDAHRDRIALPEQVQNHRATLLSPVTMDDGIRYWRFERCYGGPRRRTQNVLCLRDSESAFDSSNLITEENLRELCRVEGACVLYTHWTHPCSIPIADETIGRFALLRRWRDAGRIWVTSTAQLLDWTRRRTFLRVDCHRQGKRLVVEINGVNDPIFGVEKPGLGELHGLCLRLRRPETEITVAVHGEALRPEQIRRADTLCWIDARGALKKELGQKCHEALMSG